MKTSALGAPWWTTSDHETSRGMGGVEKETDQPTFLTTKWWLMGIWACVRLMRNGPKGTPLMHTSLGHGLRSP